MSRVGFLYHEALLGHEPPVWHPERKERLLGINETLMRSGLWEKLIHINPKKAGFDDLELVHTRDYIEKIFNFSGDCLDPDTYVSSGTFDAVRYASGAVIEAVDRCRTGDISRAFCAVRPPGHHAEAGEAMGFCIFNNIAIGAAHALRTGFRRVFIVDFDAHHGNGTQHLFEESEAVFFFSSHQYPFYPETGKESEQGIGAGKGYTYNVQIMRGSGNRDYLYLYQDILPGIIRKFGPDILLVSAGYDIHVRDPHADIRVTGEGIRGIVRSILTSYDCPAVFSLEGGYDLAALQESVAITLQEMLA